MKRASTHALAGLILSAVAACAPAAIGEPPAEIVQTGPAPRVWTIDAVIEGRPTQIAYVVVDGEAIVGGDMQIGSHAELQALVAEAPRGLVAGVDLTGFGPFGARWPGRVIPYRIDPSITDARLLERIAEAIRRWNALGIVDLTPEAEAAPSVRRTTHTLIFRDAPGSDYHCSAYVGYRRTASRQTISLNPSCPQGAVVHEIGHALGLFHEHMREDRDAFLDVSPRISRSDRNYGVIQGEHHTPYDLCSIMHYSSRTRRRPWFTLTPAGQTALRQCQQQLADQRPECVAVGQRCQFSQGDLAAIRARFSVP